MKTNIELVQHCYDKLGVNYLYAAKGEIATKTKILAWGRMYPTYYTNTRLTKALKKQGGLATDCSGLISWLTGLIRGSQGYYDTAIKRGTISSIPNVPGLAVWRKGHIGVYVGYGWVIEAKGIDYGVVLTKLSAGTWTHWLRLKDIQYVDYVPQKAITPKSSKTDIMWLQDKLNKAINAGLVVDGVYGAKTAAAVIAYWKLKGWKIGNKKGFEAGMNTIKALAA